MTLGVVIAPEHCGHRSWLRETKEFPEVVVLRPAGANFPPGLGWQDEHQSEHCRAKDEPVGLPVARNHPDGNCRSTEEQLVSRLTLPVQSRLLRVSRCLN